MEEKRRLERFDLKVPAKILVKQSEPGKNLVDLLTSNICSGGAFFHTEMPLPQGCEVEIELILPLNKLREVIEDTQEVFIKVKGKVVRAETAGMAICFDEDWEIRPHKGERETVH